MASRHFEERRPRWFWRPVDSILFSPLTPIILILLGIVAIILVWIGPSWLTITPDWLSRIQAIAAALVFIAYLGLANLAYQQIRRQEDLLKITGEQQKIQKDTLGEMQREFEMRIRPYVNITEVRTTWKRRGSQGIYDLTVAIDLKNFGHIPARNMHFSCEPEIVTAELPIPQGPKRAMGCSLFPGEEKRDAVTFRPSPDKMVKISECPAGWGLSIEIDYEGINTKYNTGAKVRFREPDPGGVDFLDGSWT